MSGEPRRLIVNADDFGVDVAVNEAVEQAHRHGILTSASLMMGMKATDDAVARARRLPGLAVGLHVTVADGKPVLPPERIPGLVGRDGLFRNDLVRSGIDWFFKPSVRAQLAAEIEAQFQAFAETSLALDHINVHKHLHLHPTVAALLIEKGRAHGARAIRIPAEPAGIVDAALPGEPAAASTPRPMLALLRRQARRAGLVMNDHAFGLAWSGAMTERKLLALIPRLPPGLSELYTHPAAADATAMPHAVPTYKYQEELAALLSPAVRAALAENGIATTSYSAAVASTTGFRGGPRSAGMTSSTQSSV